MNVKELRKKEEKELLKLLDEKRKELVKHRLDRKVGSLMNGSEITKMRREVARILTVLKEKEVLGEIAGAAQKNGKKTS